ncbi:MAG: dTMP kinase [Clostridiales Family XIII bacterium]|jgi:dTMP kinase|nr:dTMP kinase [Clostridiales Family XIII bacterium]
MGRGVFITFEGGDGSGKSTQIRLLHECLLAKGYTPIVAREPGGTRIGEQIRTVILDKENVEMCAMTEVLLYAAARAQLVSQVIKPNLDNGGIVICDRFADSSTVYQGYGRDMLDVVGEVNAHAVMGCVPDLTFLLKIQPEIGEHRRSFEKRDRIEGESRSYHREVADGYLKLESLAPERIVGIDGMLGIEEISAIIRGVVLKFLKEVE